MLYADFLNNTGRPIHKMMHYFNAYERHFGRFAGTPIKFLEIGAGNGGSSQMWKKWFGPAAAIVTIDINPLAQQYEDDQVRVRVGNQADHGFLSAVVEEFGRFDAVLDDGSHNVPDVISSFEYLYPRIADNGIYMIEDVHTAYWEEYGGGLGRGDTIVSLFKDAVDLLNIDHIRANAPEPGAVSRGTLSITAYDSVLVFEKAA